MLKSMALAFSVCLAMSAPASAEVRLVLNSGRVSIVAKDATVRQILNEWARVGQTKVVNVERIPGGPLTLELTDVPEGQALDVLLKQVSGYMAAPRASAVAALSIFDRIIVMPTPAAPRQAVASQAGAPPAFAQPQFTPQAPPPPDDDADDERPAPNVQVPNQPRGPVFNAFPPPQVGAPQTAPVAAPGVNPNGVQNQPGAPATYPGTPTAPATGGVAVPGMIVPPPPQLGTPTSPSGQPPVQMQQPGQIQRPGGRGGQPGGQ